MNKQDFFSSPSHPSGKKMHQKNKENGVNKSNNTHEEQSEVSQVNKSEEYSSERVNTMGDLFSLPNQKKDPFSNLKIENNSNHSQLIENVDNIKNNDKNNVQNITSNGSKKRPRRKSNHNHNQIHNQNEIDQNTQVSNYIMNGTYKLNELENSKKELKLNILNDLEKRGKDLEQRLSNIEENILAIKEKIPAKSNNSEIIQSPKKDSSPQNGYSSDYYSNYIISEKSDVSVSLNSISSNGKNTISLVSPKIKRMNSAVELDFKNNSLEVIQYKKNKKEIGDKISELESKLTNIYAMDFVNQYVEYEKAGNNSKLKILKAEKDILNQYLDLKMQKMKISLKINELRNKNNNYSERIIIPNDNVSKFKDLSMVGKENYSQISRKNDNSLIENYIEEISALEKEKDEIVQEITKLNQERISSVLSVGPKGVKLLTRNSLSWLKEIELTYSVKIDLNKTNNEIIIYGIDEIDIKNAQEVIQTKLNEVKEIDIRFIPSMYGTIMKHLTELQEKAKCNIRVDQLEGCIWIKNAESIQNAKQVIEEFLHESEPQSKTFDIKDENLIHRFNMSLRKKIVENSGLSNILVDVEQKQIICRGTRQSIEKASREIQSCIEKFQSQIYESITIPVESIKRVIGPKGNTIRSIEKITKCKIKVDHKTGEVTIRGDGNDRSSIAIDFIQSLIESRNIRIYEISDHAIYKLLKNSNFIQKIEKKSKVLLTFVNRGIQIIAPNDNYLNNTLTKLNTLIESIKKDPTNNNISGF